MGSVYRAAGAFSVSPLLLFVGVVLWGGTSRAIREFETKAARDIAAQLGGERRQVSVRTKPEGPFGPLFSDLASATITATDFTTEGLPLFTDPERPKTGNLRRLNIELRNFALKGLQIESLSASIPGCKFDRDLALRERQIRLSRSGTGTGTVVVRQEALEPFILRKVREIKRVKVQLGRNKAWIEGYGEFLIAKTEFLVVADLQIEDGTKLNLANARVVFGWQKADEFAKKVLLDALNPVVDLRRDLDLFDAIELTGIELKDGKMTATGNTRIPDRPKA